MTNLNLAAGLATGRYHLWNWIEDGLFRVDPKLVKHLKNATLYVAPANARPDEYEGFAEFIGAITMGEASTVFVEALIGG